MRNKRPPPYVKVIRNLIGGRYPVEDKDWNLEFPKKERLIMCLMFKEELCDGKF